MMLRYEMLDYHSGSDRVGFCGINRRSSWYVFASEQCLASLRYYSNSGLTSNKFQAHASA